MSTVFCNACGHRNPPESAFCSLCSTALESHEHTVVLHRVDPLLESASHLDDIIVDLDEIVAGIPLLVVREGETAGYSFHLRDDRTTIGRSDDSVIVLDDITVSRHHAVIERRSGRFVLSDSGSLNGSYVNQERVEMAELQQGDELQIGKYRLVFFERPDVDR